MTHTENFTNRQNAFTLIEMAMVLMIVSLLLAGLIPVMSAQMDAQRITETRKQMEDIKESLIGYTLRNGRLPCPANNTIPTGQPNAGKEARTNGSCTNLSGPSPAAHRAWGVLPWVDLGVTETDAWGRRFTYRVTANFADDFIGPAQASFTLSSNGNLNIGSAASYSEDIALGVPVVLISHGRNGLGAYTPNGTPISTSGASNDELANSNTLQSYYVSHDATPTFDDLVVWLSPNVLFNRMVTAGKLP